MSDAPPSSFERIGSLLDRNLIDALNELHPHRCPDIKDSEREIWMKAGERRLVDFLDAAYRVSTETVLTTPSITGNQ